MKINKKLVLIDLLTLCGTLIMYLITSISNNIFGIYNLAVNIIICLLTIAVSVWSILYSYYKKTDIENVGFANLIITIIFFILAFITYFIPIFGFIGNNGINNSVCFLMLACLGVRSWLIISQLVKAKSLDISMAIKVPGSNLKNSKSNYQNLSRYIKYFALFLFAVSIVIAIVNTFLLFLDLSNARYIFSDLDPHFEILGQEIN